MTIDLSQYVDEDVYITLRRGIKQTGCVVPSKSFNSYWVAGLLFCKDGKRSTEHINDNDIIHIELVQKPMTKYEQLEQQIKELQNEVDRLKKEEEEEKKNKLPKNFNRKAALHCIKTQYRHHLAFLDWRSTPQGLDYWSDIYHNRAPFTNAAIMQLQEWVIMSYQQEFEGK
jgi:hypothetical protein